MKKTAEKAAGGAPGLVRGGIRNPTWACSQRRARIRAAALADPAPARPILATGSPPMVQMLPACQSKSIGFMGRELSPESLMRFFTFSNLSSSSFFFSSMEPRALEK